jgi:hypothetical protein
MNSIKIRIDLKKTNKLRFILFYLTIFLKIFFLKKNLKKRRHPLTKNNTKFDENFKNSSTPWTQHLEHLT